MSGIEENEHNATSTYELLMSGENINSQNDIDNIEFNWPGL